MQGQRLGEVGPGLVEAAQPVVRLAEVAQVDGLAAA